MPCINRLLLNQLSATLTTEENQFITTDSKVINSSFCYKCTDSGQQQYCSALKRDGSNLLAIFSRACQTRLEYTTTGLFNVHIWYPVYNIGTRQWSQFSRFPILISTIFRGRKYVREKSTYLRKLSFSYSQYEYFQILFFDEKTCPENTLLKAFRPLLWVSSKIR